MNNLKLNKLKQLRVDKVIIKSVRFLIAENRFLRK